MSMRLWNVPYSVIQKKVDGDPKNIEEKRKKELLDLLYNVRIIEVTPKSYNDQSCQNLKKKAKSRYQG